MRNNAHFILLKASLQCHCMSCPQSVQKCIAICFTWLSLTLHANIRDGQNSQIGYDIYEFDSLRSLGIDVIDRVHFDNQDRFSISMGSIGKATEPCQQTTEWLLTSDFLLFLEPWHARWYEYKIFIALCTDSIYNLENERWLFGDMIHHVGIYGSRVAEGLLTFNVGLVLFVVFKGDWQ